MILSTLKETNRRILPLQIAILPLIFLVTLLSFNLYANVFIYDADPLAGSSQFILILSGAFAALIGHRYNVSYKDVINSISNSIKSVTPALIILLWVGALAGTWMISGIIPSMVYYGLKILDPNIFLPACIIICSIISVATGSSWTTSATVGIALVGIGKALEIPAGMVGGAVIAGAYFGDKLSPLSDTTNLAAAVSKVDLFKHIKYLTYTTIPSISITLIVFIILGINQSSSGVTDNSFLINTIENTFNISLVLFIVPIIVLIMIVKKTPPIKALTVGTLLGALFAILFQPQIINELSDSSNNSIIASSRHTPPVGFDGELIITPFMDELIFDFKSSKSGSKFLSGIVSTRIGFASAILTNSGNETQYGEKTITLSFGLNIAWHALYRLCFSPFDTRIFLGL